MTVTRAEVVVEARTWLNVPYEHQGRSRFAVDCAGLVICVARAKLIVAADFDVTGYERTPDGTSLLVECDRWMTRIPMNQMRPADVLVYAFIAELGPQHMGIIADYRYGGHSLIQALAHSNGKGRVVESNISRERRGWIPIQAYAMPGVV